MRTIAQNICYYRNKKQLTQQQLADKLNVSHHTISKWECGNNIPSVEDLKQLAQIFGLTLDELTNDNDKLAIRIFVRFWISENPNRKKSCRS